MNGKGQASTRKGHCTAVCSVHSIVNDGKCIDFGGKKSKKCFERFKSKQNVFPSPNFSSEMSPQLFSFIQFRPKCSRSWCFLFLGSLKAGPSNFWPCCGEEIVWKACKDFHKVHTIPAGHLLKDFLGSDFWKPWSWDFSLLQKPNILSLAWDIKVYDIQVFLLIFIKYHFISDQYFIF